MTQARFENLVGQHVRWGGEVASVTPTERETCFEIIDRPLASDGRPFDSAPSQGRFLACTPQFFPRGLYEGEDVTVAGTLERSVKAQLDELKYRYPRVAIAALAFWPRSQKVLAGASFPRAWRPGGAQSYLW